MNNTYNEADYPLCGCCGDEWPKDHMRDWHGEPVCPTCFDSEAQQCRMCSIKLGEGDGTQPSCADCTHDCQHMYDDSAPECMRCGYLAPSPYAHLRLILGGAK